MTTAWRESKTAGGGSTDDITNASGVSGTTASDALDTLASNLVAEASARAAADLLLAPLASPVFTGNPRGPTPTLGDNDTSLATTAFVAAAITAAPATWGGITGTLSNQTDLQSALTAKAPLASPTFTGTPAAPTAAPATSTTQLATTAFVTTADNLKAPLASPALTGTPTAPTAAPGTNTTQLATTAFATAATKTVYFPVTINGTTVANNNGYIVVPAPGAGTILSYAITFFPYVDGDLTIYASQSGIPYSPGATITSANNPGETVSAAPVDAIYAAGAGIEFEISTANTTPGVCVAMVTYQLE